jgi:hypothetical protein
LKRCHVPLNYYLRRTGDEALYLSDGYILYRPRKAIPYRLVSASVCRAIYQPTHIYTHDLRLLLRKCGYKVRVAYSAREHGHSYSLSYTDMLHVRSNMRITHSSLLERTPGHKYASVRDDTHSQSTYFLVKPYGYKTI